MINSPAAIAPIASDYTALALVVDRSGSMGSIANEVKGSVKQFVEDQQKKSGRASLTVAQFDHEYEVVHDFVDLTKVDATSFSNQYQPRGMTALLDAIGRTASTLKQKIEAMPEAERPKRVVVAVITDGLENSSKEYTLDKIKALVKQQEGFGWDFMFLGASLDAINVGTSYGFSSGKSACFSTSNFEGSMQVISDKASAARCNQPVAFSEKERADMLNTLNIARQVGVY